MQPSCLSKPVMTVTGRTQSKNKVTKGGELSQGQKSVLSRAAGPRKEEES